MAHITAVIWDIDGTLVDSNDQHAHAWVEALKRGGYSVPYREVRRLVGMGSDKMLPITAGVKKDTPEGKQLSAWWSEIFKAKYLDNIRAFPRAKELLQRLHDRGLGLAVASSGEEDIVQKLIDTVGAGNLFHQETSSADAKQSKPDPDIIQAALEKLRCKAEDVVMVGDTPYDIEAAGKAGVQVIGLRSGGWTDEDLRGAIAVYDSPADMLDHLDRAPLNSLLQTE